MSRTFSYRRDEIVKESPAVEDLLHRWPALFEVTQDETAERDVVIRCLVLPLSENGEDLIKDDPGAPIDEMKAELAQQSMKIFTKGGPTEDDPLHAGRQRSSGWSVKHSKGMCLASWTDLCCEH
ncbi:hypothetical protein SRHO_G00284460 [Serrasalmus rhombeus]